MDSFNGDFGTSQSRKKIEPGERAVRFSIDIFKHSHAKLRSFSDDKNVRMTKLVKMIVAIFIARLEED